MAAGAGNVGVVSTASLVHPPTPLIHVKEMRKGRIETGEKKVRKSMRDAGGKGKHTRIDVIHPGWTDLARHRGRPKVERRGWQPGLVKGDLVQRAGS